FRRRASGTGLFDADRAHPTRRHPPRLPGHGRAPASCGRAHTYAGRASLGLRRPMPPIVRRYIKTSFLFLVAGLLLGGYILLAEFVMGRYPPRLFITAHVHLLLVGFMLMIVMGVGPWLFPRPGRDDARYRPALAEAVYWIMTIGTALRAISEVAAGVTEGTAILRALIVVGGSAQLMGALLFVLNMWWRVRMPVTPAPPAR